MTRLSVESAPRHEFKFKGVSVQVPFTFTEGHALTENEARFMNRTLASVIGNLTGSKISATIEALVKGDKDKGVAPLSREDATAQALANGADGKSWQTIFDEKFAEYELGVNNRAEGSGQVIDPVAKLARQIADGEVRKLLKGKNIPFKKVQGEVFAKLVSDYVDQNPWVSALAKTQVEAIQAQSATPSSDDLFAGLDLGSEDETSTDEAPTEQPTAEGEVDGEVSEETDPQA